ncbi:haloacid dehalogenase superfamily, subfamily IA, variant 3 with third motif having DD or ED/haloacid dehalogenase superfamily, subfamily IA, variant 1 with third motif having Dx(3-4)D or Dx(3-4)E [Lachnospiraceae bacterium XBB1006]|nr:haloacid dehalogenase superfamily, subfamily IA, variant 3 with third motif having DD or ED/haloacid dehalogenase superfamily, subfamily IA, variant 1 with third motif having Dx(3-4)D or Dx(3-4)E [Lachnospiraceae bacterium XBB1006]
MYKNYKAIIFDMDGTLIDSMWVWPKLDEDFFKNEQLPMPETLQKDIEGYSMKETAEYFIKNFSLSYTVSELMDLWNDMASYQYANEVPYKKGAFEFLKKVKDLGIKTGIATSNSRELVELVDQNLHFSSYIDTIVTAKEVPCGKPAPDIYLTVANHLNVDPKDCLVFEDIPNGLLAAIRAGMDTCAVSDEFSRDMDFEKRQMATHFIDSYEELLA